MLYGYVANFICCPAMQNF